MRGGLLGFSHMYKTGAERDLQRSKASYVRSKKGNQSVVQEEGEGDFLQRRPCGGSLRRRGKQGVSKETLKDAQTMKSEKRRRIVEDHEKGIGDSSERKRQSEKPRKTSFLGKSGNTLGASRRSGGISGCRGGEGA